MACFKGPPAQFGKIPTRTPSQPLLSFPKPAFIAAPLVAAGIDSPASIPSRSLISWGGGRRRRRMGRDWGCKRAAAARLRDPRLRSRNGSQGSNQAPGTSASARAQSRLGAECPALRMLVLTLQTPCSHPGSSSFHAPYLAPPESLSQRAPHLGHPMSFEPCVCAPHLRCIPCQKNPTPSIPAVRTPHV